MDAPRRLGGSYRVERLLGEGASGQVWYGIDAFDRPVAVKIFRPELANDRAVVQRFIQERGLLESVHDPQIVAVHDLVVEGNTLAIVMDYIDGPDLRALLRDRGTLPPAEAVDVVRQVAVALHAVHGKGIVHRDVKPENVLMAEGRSPRLADFGIAKIVDAGQTSTMLLGTPLYMAPELAQGRPPTAASDVYSLGIMLYELLYGVTPFAGRPSAMATLSAHANEVPGRPGNSPDMLWDLLTAMLAKDPAVRPGSAAVADRLSALKDQVRDLPALAALTSPPPTMLDPRAQPSPEQVTQAATTQLGNRPSPWSVGGQAADSWPTILSPPREPPPQKKRGGLILGVAMGCLAIAVAVAVTILVLNSRSSPHTTTAASTATVASTTSTSATPAPGTVSPSPSPSPPLSPPSTMTVTVSAPASTAAAAASSPAPVGAVVPTMQDGDRTVRTYMDRFSAGTLSPSDMGILFTPTVQYYKKTQTRGQVYDSYTKTDLVAYNGTYEPPQFVSYRGATTYGGRPASALDYSVSYHKPGDSGQVLVTYIIVKDDDGENRIAAISERPT